MQVIPMAQTITELGRRLSPSDRDAVGRFLEELIAIVDSAGDAPVGPNREM